MIQYYTVLYCIVMSDNITHASKDAPASAPAPSPASLDLMIRIIMSQTEMPHDEVVSALERTNYDLKKVIREYMTSGVSTTTESTAVEASSSVSANQLRFSEIRNFMDKSDETYRRNLEMTRIYQQVMEKKKQQAADQAASKL